MTARGISVLSSADIINISARDKDKSLRNVSYEATWSSLDPLTALQIYQRCAPVFSVVSKRASAISALEWHIEPQKKEEDRIAERLKTAKEIYFEFDQPNLYHLGKRIAAFKEIRHYLPDCFPDLSNFDSCLKRWYRNIKTERADKCAEIEEFFYRPNPTTLWPDFIKQYVIDLHIQGRNAIYKETGIDNLSEIPRVINLHNMPGGTVVPVKGIKIGSQHGFIQLTDTLQEPILFHSDEIAFSVYMPNSSLSYGMNPLDALINLVAENLLFNALMANMADGSKPPEKAIIFGDKNPGLDIEKLLDNTFDDPLDKDEQRRIENKLNRAKREAGIAILSGVGTPAILDLSRADTIPTQINRQEQINKYVAMVFNATQSEVNDTGSSGTSGRSTAEVQERAENSKGIRPIIRMIEEVFTREIIPYRFGFGYEMVFVSSRSDEEIVNLAKLKKDSGIFSVNEIRVKDFNEDAIPDPAFDVPQSQTPQQAQEGLLTDIANSVRR